MDFSRPWAAAMPQPHTRPSATVNAVHQHRRTSFTVLVDVINQHSLRDQRRPGRHALVASGLCTTPRTREREFEGRDETVDNVPMSGAIRIVSARVHNLKNVSLDIPRDRVVVFTGVSGSGKSSLVFDTLHTEAQRQLIETFSSFARRRLPKLSRPAVDAIHHLSTSIVIDQKPLGRTLRSP